MPLRVLHVMNSLQPSGMERMFVSAHPYWTDFGIAVRVLGQGPTNPFSEDLRRAGVDVVTVPRLGTTRGAVAFARELRRWRPHVIHVHSERSYWIAATLARRLGYRALVRTVHSTFRPKGLKRAYRKVVARIVDRHMASIVACSPDVAEHECAEFDRDCEVVLNWVDDRFFTVRPGRTEARRDPLVLLVGNCSRIKRHGLALETALKSGLEVIHLGSESGIDTTEERLLDLLERRGQLVKRGVDDPASWMTLTPTFALPSTHEGMSVSLAEAIAADLPAVVSDSPGLQWARKFAGIKFVRDGESWDRALASLPAECVGRSIEARDEFRPRRGVEQYSLIYQGAIGS